jgi:hypothetical protein
MLAGEPLTAAQRPRTALRGRVAYSGKLVMGAYRRVLDLDQVRADTAKTRLYTSFLPWEEAKTPLAEATRHPQAEDRAAGYELLAKCAGRAGRAEAVTEAVESFRRLRNEQDPVRARALRLLRSWHGTSPTDAATWTLFTPRSPRSPATLA